MLIFPLDRVAQSSVNGTWKLDVAASVEEIEAGTETKFSHQAVELSYASAERGLAISSRRDRSALTPHNASTTAAPNMSSAAIKYP